MRIAELEGHENALQNIESQIREKRAIRDFSTVFELCQAALPHVEPVFRLRKRRGDTPLAPSLLAFSALWKYGPPLFEYRTLKHVYDFIASTRFLARHENNYLKSTELAIGAAQTARVLWNCLESNPGFRQRRIRADLGLDQERAVSILEIWESLGIIDRFQEHGSYRLYLRTNLTQEAPGVCLNCNSRVKGRKARLLQPVKCKRCGVKGYFFLPLENVT